MSTITLYYQCKLGIQRLCYQKRNERIKRFLLSSIVHLDRALQRLRSELFIVRVLTSIIITPAATSGLQLSIVSVSVMSVRPVL